MIVPRIAGLSASVRGSALDADPRFPEVLLVRDRPPSLRLDGRPPEGYLLHVGCLRLHPVRRLARQEGFVQPEGVEH